MFTTDERTENLLRGLGAKYKYTNGIKFSQLEPGWDQKNIGRSKVKIDSAVAQYGRRMDQGSPAPAPILHNDKTAGHLGVCDGVQRLITEEMRSGDTFSAYVVDTDSVAMVCELRVFTNHNLQGGHQESSDWTMGNVIVELLNTGLRTVREVAERGGWSQSAVRAKKICIDYGEAVRSVGGPDKLPDGMLQAIAKHSDIKDFVEAPVIVATFLNAIKRMKIGTDTADPHIELFFAVNRNRGNGKVFRQFEANLKDFHKDEEVKALLADPSKQRYKALTADVKILKHLKGALTMAKNARDNGERITNIDEFCGVMAQIKTALQQMKRPSKKRK